MGVYYGTVQSAVWCTLTRPPLVRTHTSNPAFPTGGVDVGGLGGFVSFVVAGVGRLGHPLRGGWSHSPPVGKGGDVDDSVHVSCVRVVGMWGGFCFNWSFYVYDEMIGNSLVIKKNCKNVWCGIRAAPFSSFDSPDRVSHTRGARAPSGGPGGRRRRGPHATGRGRKRGRGSRWTRIPPRGETTVSVTRNDR